MRRPKQSGQRANISPCASGRKTSFHPSSAWPKATWLHTQQVAGSMRATAPMAPSLRPTIGRLSRGTPACVVGIAQAPATPRGAGWPRERQRHPTWRVVARHRRGGQGGSRRWTTVACLTDGIAVTDPWCLPSGGAPLAAPAPLYGVWLAQACCRTILFPSGSRTTASAPQGRCCSGASNSTPLATSAA